ncbi:16S rRNA (cytosine(1402)-N(4))-methyltransferase RsmH [Ruminobacter sp. RM87]|uniref:16S rRNA (cytosine(1402)-N(4))-methyltransferase RsmH n=1 Tax=Ruminobacter sp. RM87 TaxID=1200567 RepID=UPI0004E138DA|nr:16S rRNA (cytosine(1402)-N(4))-methyltransferase RsmH [Ruminobacter sp. RM87]
MNGYKHVTVLLKEAVDALEIKPNGTYLDCTFGRGGHSREILSRLGPDGRLFAIDRDPEAVKAAQDIKDSRFTIIHGCFADALSLLEPSGVVGQIDGMLLDLGVSSPQLDDPERGFSFMNDGPLDMRMDPSEGVSAAEWVNSAGADEIARVLHDFGEERFARKIAAAIVHDRVETPFTTTRQLSSMIARVIPIKEKGKHPATRSFQAIRILVNSELDQVEKALENSKRLLGTGGLLSVISFHSLEDRLVKNFMRRAEKGIQPPRGLPVSEDEILKTRTFKTVGKAIYPSDEEVSVNPRSRSAVLRVARRWGSGV